MIYISGPITGTDDYMERFAAAEKELTSKGYDVINPARYNAQLPKYTLYRDYIRISLRLLDICSDICMLEGWKDSKGARLEYAYAEALGKRIIYQTLPTGEKEEKKYYWVLSGFPKTYSCYLNLNTRDDIVLVSNSDESDTHNTKFTESEYKKLAKKYQFSEDMFVKEEIE